MTTANDYAGYSKDELVNLCRARNVSGHSKKKVPELIELLMKAGVVPEKKTDSTAVKKASKDTDSQSISSTSSTSSHEYIFHADWRNVLQYLDNESTQLVIVDLTLDGGSSNDWFGECIRTLEPNGILAIRGISDSDSNMPDIPKSMAVDWVSVGSEKVLITGKDTVTLFDPQPTITTFYNSLITRTRSDATILLPFANETLSALVRKHRRSFVTMNEDSERVTRLYASLS